MPQLGRIEQWNDDKGYGFVHPLESQAANGGDAARTFVHIKAIARAGRRPANGDLIRYDSERDARGRLNAVNVSFVNAEAMRAQAQRRMEAKAAACQNRASGVIQDRVHRALLACAVLALAAGTWQALWPPAVPLAYAAMSLVTFLAYRHDKHAAGSAQRRTPETTLHLLGLLGGWPGGLLAQQAYRHKTRKNGFQFVFWITVMVNCAALLWWVSTHGSPP